jgi:hypothetical protein
MGVGSQCYTLAILPLGKTKYLLYRRLGGPQVHSGWVQKIMPPLGVKPQTVQPVAGYYTNYVIPAHTQYKFNECNTKVFTSVISITAFERGYLIAH